MSEPKSRHVTILESRRGRVLRAVLAAKERIADPKLTNAEAADLRKVVLEEVNDLVDLAINLIVSDEERLAQITVLNELWIQQVVEDRVERRLAELADLAEAEPAPADLIADEELLSKVK